MADGSRIRKPIRVNLEARAASAELRRARTRERLLDAAEAVIAAKGVPAASIDELVRAAGVSRGTFYNYFPTTADVLEELNRRLAEGLRERLLQVARRPVDPATRMAASLHAILHAYMTDAVRGWVAQQIAGSLAPRQRRFATLFEALYREGVAAGQFHDVASDAAMAVCFGAMRMVQRDVVVGDGPDHSIEVVALVLTAVGVPFPDASRMSAEEARTARAGQA